MTKWIFKILRPAEWETAKTSSRYAGSADDVADGFIHFSTWEQLPGTSHRHFGDMPAVHVLAFAPSCWEDGLLKWEPSRGGALFPHLYAPLDVNAATQRWRIDRDGTGPFDFSEIDQWMTANA